MDEHEQEQSKDFDMPETGTWEQRGGWVVKALADDLGLTLPQAAGIVGNIGFESAGFTHLQEIRPVAGRGGYGWAQWTGPRRRQYEQFCSAEKLDPKTDYANFSYLEEELTKFYGSMLDRLSRVSKVEDAVFLVGRLYEAPGGTTANHLPGYGGRLDFAKRALAGAQEKA